MQRKFNFTYLFFGCWLFCSLTPLFTLKSFAEESLSCKESVDKNLDNIPDDLTLKNNVDWSNCNIENKILSKTQEFDWNNTSRQVSAIGMPEDAHWNPTTRFDGWIQKLFHFFGFYYDVYASHYSGGSLKSANLIGTNLHGVTLIDTNLAWANLSDANLSESNLTGTNFHYALLTNVDFTGANLERTMFYQSEGDNVTFRNADLYYACLLYTSDAADE